MLARYIPDGMADPVGRGFWSSVHQTEECVKEWIWADESKCEIEQIGIFHDTEECVKPPLGCMI